MSKIIEAIELEDLTRLLVEGKKIIPVFRPGVSVVVWAMFQEGSRVRSQAFEGVVISKRNRGINSSFTVRKISSGEGVERTFQLYAPNVEKIDIKRRGDVRRAKLYYLRGLTGKAARIKEKLPNRK